MIRSLALRRLLFSLFIGLTALCVLAKPITSAAHEVHELAHVLADAGADGVDPDEDGGLDPLHTEDGCCFHAVAAPMPDVDTFGAPRSVDRLDFREGVRPPTLVASLLRPPISA